LSLVLHNTLSRRKEAFHPLDPERVRLYVCGPTVYDLAHIGNARPVIVFDLLFRVLRRIYGAAHVVYARNITDVDDKIIERARSSGETIRELTERTNFQYQRDVAGLLCLPPTVTPRATEHIAEMIAMIEALVAGGHAYAAAGHVLFQISTMPAYGALSGRSLEDMRAGARVEVAPYKRDAGDFVLWKPSTGDQPGWESPWGFGRPGWHIECSAMAERHLGEHFDIHGGGIDLVFPHHENEIAQSVCAHGGRPFVSVWMHNAFLDLGGEKMSKSLGNVLAIKGLLERFPGEALRYAMLGAHYRDPLDWNDDRVREARAAVERFYTALRPLAGLQPVWPDAPVTLAALQDDLNSPLALALLHEQASRLFKAASDRERALAKGELLAGGRLMGLLDADPETWFRWKPAGETGLGDDEIDRLVEARREARAKRNFAEADRLRGHLARHGVLLDDGPQGTVWRRT
jgi:cysteinyl-tRNA synthetase